MSGFRGVMASDLLTAGVKLDDATACAQALLGARWRATQVVEWLDDAMALARSMETAQVRETIIRDMAHAGDALPVDTGNHASSEETFSTPNLAAGYQPQLSPAALLGGGS